MNRIGYDMNVLGNLNFKFNLLLYLIVCVRILINIYRLCYLCFVNMYFFYSLVLKNKIRDVFGYVFYFEDFFDKNGGKV